MNTPNLEKLSDQKLIRAYYALDRYVWPGVLGEKPPRWDKLRNYRPVRGNILTKIFIRKTKMDYALPIMSEIQRIIGMRLLNENRDSILPIKDMYLNRINSVND